MCGVWALGRQEQYTEVRRAREGILDFEALKMARRRMCEQTRGRHRAVRRLRLEILSASLSPLPRLVSSPWSRRGEPGKAENPSYVFSQLILVQNNPYAKVAYLDHSLNLSRAVWTGNWMRNRNEPEMCITEPATLMAESCRWGWRMQNINLRMILCRGPGT